MDAAEIDASPSAARRPPSRLRLDLAVALLLFAALAAAVARWGVDLPHLDEWVLAFDLESEDGGELIRRAWTPHNEHRLFVPRLALAGLARVTGWNVRVELGLVALAAGGLLALVWRLGRDLPAGAPRTAYRVASAVFVLGLHQVENLVWGWQLSLFLSALAALAALDLLGRPGGGRARLGGAIVLGAVASFSYAAGLMVWPAGAAQLAVSAWSERRRGAAARWGTLAAWSLAAIGVAAAYLPGDGPASAMPSGAMPAGGPSAVAAHALAFLGSPLVQAWRSPAAAVAAGAAGVLAFAVWWGRELRRGRGADPWLGLALLAIGAAGMTALGRSGYGLEQALSSRYTTLANLLWIALLGGLASGARGARGRLAIGAGLAGLALAGSAASVDGFVGQHAMRSPVRSFLQRGVLVTELAPLVAGDLGFLRTAARSICEQRTSVFREARGAALECRFEVWPAPVHGLRALPERRMDWRARADARESSGVLRTVEGFEAPVGPGAVEGEWTLTRERPDRRCLRGWARDAVTGSPVAEVLVVEGGSALRVPFRREERPALAAEGVRFLGIAACWEPIEPAAGAREGRPPGDPLVLATNDRGGTGALGRRR